LRWLKDPYPEAFLVELNYSHFTTKVASSMEILALMLAIPESFKPKKDLYGTHDKTKIADTELILRGFVAYSGNHYVCYTRALKTKLDYVVGEDRLGDVTKINE
jgi:hypothetical protein